MTKTTYSVYLDDAPLFGGQAPFKSLVDAHLVLERELTTLLTHPQLPSHTIIRALTSSSSTVLPRVASDFALIMADCTPRRGEGGDREDEQVNFQTPEGPTTTYRHTPNHQSTSFVIPLAEIPGVTPVFDQDVTQGYAAPMFSPGPIPDSYRSRSSWSIRASRRSPH
jgi:hypothetical protein